MAVVNSTRAALLSVLIGVFVTCPKTAFAIVNYYNDPDLAKAMEFDMELNGGDREKADRGQAEHYYLRYLENAKESFQQARVYCQLGALYATAYNPQKGEKDDDRKALDYYRKALAIEPNRIDVCMIRARSMVADLGYPFGFEKLKARMELYQWLGGLNEQKLKERWLPLSPAMPPQTTTITNDKGEVVSRITKRQPGDPNVPPPGHVVGLVNYIKALKDVSIRNATSFDTMAMPVAEQGWTYILQHLPADAPERSIVEKAMKEKRKQIADAALQDILKSLTPATGQDARPSDSNAVRSAQTGQASVEVIVKDRFIPRIDFAKKQNMGFILDLKSSVVMAAPVDAEFDSEGMYQSLTKLGKGDIAWDGDLLITTRKAQLSSVVEESKRPLKATAAKYGNKYGLTDKNRLPYTLVASTKEGGCYLIKIVRITAEGIRVMYRELSPGEISRYVAGWQPAQSPASDK